MEKLVFDFTSYKAYLDGVLKGKPAGGRGFRAQMAEAIGCQRAFVSQVLQGDAHFNLEHGDKLNQFLQHTKEEAHFFLVLIQYARAGTESLRQYFREQMNIVLDHRLQLKSRIRSEDALTHEQKARYYSSWHYGAARVALTIPSLRTKEVLAKKLQLTIPQLQPILDFLLLTGLIEQKGNEFHPTTRHMHLGNDSALVSKHHTNWRIRSIQSFDTEGAKDLHYSSTVSLSQEDALKIKAILVNNVEEVQKRIRDSKEETLFSFCLDFYEI